MTDKSMPETVFFPHEVPELPAVFVAFAHKGGVERVVHIGVASNVHKALSTLLEKQTRDFLAGGNSSQFSEVRWWLHDDFHDPVVLEAAGLVALDAFDRKVHKRPQINPAAWKLHNEATFCIRMASEFSGKAHGRLVVPSLAQALRRLSAVEQRLRQLENRLQALVPDCIADTLPGTATVSSSLHPTTHRS
jgi:hypothetical protein